MQTAPFQGFARIARRNTGEVSFKKITGREGPFCLNVGGVDGARTRDPRRDRPVF